MFYWSVTHLDLPGREEVPVILQISRLHLLVIDEDLIGTVGFHDQGVYVGVHVILAANFLLDKVVLALVAEDYMYLKWDWIVIY